MSTAYVLKHPPALDIEPRPISGEDSGYVTYYILNSLLFIDEGKNPLDLGAYLHFHADSLS